MSVVSIALGDGHTLTGEVTVVAGWIRAAADDLERQAEIMFGRPRPQPSATAEPGLRTSVAAAADILVTALERTDSSAERTTCRRRPGLRVIQGGAR